MRSRCRGVNEYGIYGSTSLSVDKLPASMSSREIVLT